MNNSKRGFFQITVFTFALALFFASALAHLLDQKHSATPCAAWEREYWRGEGKTFFRFERVSTFFWSSLCADDSPPLLFSASEGTVEPTFVSYFPGFREFTGSHKGIKTFGFLAGHQVHPDRLKNFRALVLINPVYFSFAATTDEASILLNAISPLSYTLSVPAWKRKWDDFVLDWFYAGLKNYVSEWSRLRDPPLVERPSPPGQALAPPGDSAFIAERNLLHERAGQFTSFRARFSRKEEPTNTLFKQSVQFAKDHPEAKICFVLLPLNATNLKYFGRDAAAITASMKELFDEMPPGQGLNLLDMNETPKIFLDPMHFNSWGVSQVAQKIRASECAKPIIGGAE